MDRTSPWVDPVVGARGSLRVLDDLALFARADVGGFDIGQASGLSCNTIVGLEDPYSDCLSLIGGYRWL